MFLCIDMFASKSNVVLCDEHGTIIDAFLNKKEILSTMRELQTIEREISVSNILPSQDRFPIEASGNDDLVKQLKKSVP